MVGMFLIFGFTAVGMKALLCGVFLLITSPTAAHALSRAAYRSGIKLWDKSVVDRYGEDLRKSQ
jgi:multicomponent Na+:H+ antiporter subunit G